MVTRPAVERFRPGIIDWESSKLNLTGHVPTVPRYTATGAPGESTDFATIKSVAPAGALARSAAARDTSPLTMVPDPAAPTVAPGAPTLAPGATAARGVPA